MTPHTSPKDRPVVAAICRAIESDTNWDIAESATKTHFYILRAAHNLGRFEPFSEDELALNAYLERCRAGRRLCDYAWRMLAASQAA